MIRFSSYDGMCKWAEERLLIVQDWRHYSAKYDHLSVYGVPITAWITTDNGTLTCEFDKNGTLFESFFDSGTVDGTIGDVDRSGSLRSKLDHLMGGSTD